MVAKYVKILSLLFLIILLFQSWGMGLLQTNFHDNAVLYKHSFTDGLMAFFRPMSIYSVWDKLNFLFPILAFTWIWIIFMFIRRVKIKSWQFAFFIIITLTFSYIGYWGCMVRFRDILTPMVLLTIFGKTNEAGR